MKKLLFIIFLSMIGSKGFSQVLIENDLSVPISVCFGWEQQKGDWKGMRTYGWFSIDPGQTINPGLPLLPMGNNGHFFYYAKTTSGPFREVTTGNANMLVDPINAFDIKNADLSYTKDQHPDYDWRPFIRKEVHLKALQTVYTWKMTILDISNGY